MCGFLKKSCWKHGLYLPMCDTKCFRWSGPWALRPSARGQVPGSLGWVQLPPNTICTSSLAQPPAHYLSLPLWLPQAVMVFVWPLIRWHQLINPANSAFWEPPWLHYVQIELGITTAFLARTGQPVGNYKQAASPLPKAGDNSRGSVSRTNIMLCALFSHSESSLATSFWAVQGDFWVFLCAWILWIVGQLSGSWRICTHPPSQFLAHSGFS